MQATRGSAAIVATGAPINSVQRTSCYPNRQTSERPMRDLPSCAWIEKTLIEDSSPFTCTSDIVLGDTFHDPENRREFGLVMRPHCGPPR